MTEEHEFTFIPVYGEHCDHVLVEKQGVWGMLFVDAFFVPSELRTDQGTITSLIAVGKPFKVKVTLEVIDD